MTQGSAGPSKSIASASHWLQDNPDVCPAKLQRTLCSSHRLQTNVSTKKNWVLNILHLRPLLWPVIVLGERRAQGSDGHSMAGALNIPSPVTFLAPTNLQQKHSSTAT